VKRNPLLGWREKVVGSLVLLAFAPVLLVTGVQAISTVVGALAGVLWSLVPYAVTVLVLGSLYRLVFGRYR
jgi:hypothetical protein